MPPGRRGPRSLKRELPRSRSRRSDSIRVVLFGAGAMGTVAARHLVRLKEINDLVIADLVPVRARALAAALRSLKARAVPLRDPAPGGLAQVLRDADLAINAAHADLDLPLMDACLEAGSNYMDLSSEPSKQLPYDTRFRNAGLTALMGGGEDPGIGNVFARRGVDALDTVDAIRIRDGDTASASDTPLPVVWSPETFLVEVFSPGLVFEDGKLIRPPPWSGRETYPFPEPVGPQPVYLMDHEEPETLGRFIGKGLRYADLKLAIDDATYHVLRTIHDLGLLRDEPLNVEGTRVSPRKLLMSLVRRPADLVGRVTGTAMIVVEVDGSKDGERVSQRLYTGMRHEDAARRHNATATGYLVGTGAAVFATQFVRGQIAEKGVISAECLDPAESLRLMGRMGLRVAHETQTATPLN
ncbi:MAG TPA: saccharopine dehydrogenase C-terminal domain-containing protein [Thermoplasmata archaeon]|nr:saccharopine dehydrogenase C-terminal domain-containing protein [Thermoplasmata archaeon]